MSGTVASIKGMTGFGRGLAEREGLRVEAEVKGVNHRFLDLKLKLPLELAAAEAELRSRIQARVGRGRLDIALSLASAAAPRYQVVVNHELVGAYLGAAAALKKEFRLRGAIPIETVMTLPGAVAIRTEGAATNGLAGVLAGEALDRALAAYESMRLEEGRRLVAALRGHFAAIEVDVGSIESDARGLPEAYARRLRERVEALVRERGLDDLRLAQEVALLADRVDLTEELVRLRGYLEQGRTSLDHPEGPVGKTLDFVMQEMNREANTISSKAEALSICQAALRVKSEVEKIREQVQNLE